jgi:hypothetical protein
MILNEMGRLRDHTRYFLIDNGHANALSLPGDPRGKNVLTLPRENEVPEELKELLDDIAREEGLEERLKLEVWDDVHARNVSVSPDHRTQCGFSRDVVRHFLCLVLRVSISNMRRRIPIQGYADDVFRRGTEDGRSC